MLAGIEAIGLWFAKRWAEYLTFVATIVLLPIEVRELIKSVTWLKVLALVINLAVAAYLLYAKRLFGLRGGGRAERAEREADTGWTAIERATPASTPEPLLPGAGARGGAVVTRSFAPDVHDWPACARGERCRASCHQNPSEETSPEASLERSAVPEGSQRAASSPRGQGPDRGQQRCQRGGGDAVAGGQRLGRKERGSAGRTRAGRHGRGGGSAAAAARTGTGGRGPA